MRDSRNIIFLPHTTFLTCVITPWVCVREVAARLAPSWWRVQREEPVCLCRQKPSCCHHVCVFVLLLLFVVRRCATVSTSACVFFDRQHRLGIDPQLLHRRYSSCGSAGGLYRNTRCRGADSGMHKHTPLHTPLGAQPFRCFLAFLGLDRGFAH